MQRDRGLTHECLRTHSGSWISSKKSRHWIWKFGGLGENILRSQNQILFHSSLYIYGWFGGMNPFSASFFFRLAIHCAPHDAPIQLRNAIDPHYSHKNTPTKVKSSWLVRWRARLTISIILSYCFSFVGWFHECSGLSWYKWYTIWCSFYRKANAPKLGSPFPGRPFMCMSTTLRFQLLRDHFLR